MSKNEYKLDIFQTLEAIDKRNKNYYDNLSDDEKKGFQPLVAMRWASAVNNGSTSEYYIWLINERANLNFFDLYEHPELQYKLISSCGVGTKQRHQWVPMAKREVQNNKLTEFLLKYFPSSNETELNIILSQFDKNSFKDFVKKTGLPDEEINDVIKAYDRIHNGKTKAKK